MADRIIVWICNVACIPPKCAGRTPLAEAIEGVGAGFSPASLPGIWLLIAKALFLE